MTDQEWYNFVKENYEEVAADLVEQGYSRNERADIYKEDFTSNEETLVIVRHLGSANWWTKEVSV